jgi:hypothetical protein
LARGGKR